MMINSYKLIVDKNEKRIYDRDLLINLYKENGYKLTNEWLNCGLEFIYKIDCYATREWKSLKTLINNKANKKHQEIYNEFFKKCKGEY